MSEKKNKLKSDKKSKILILITILLTFLYALSFVKSCTSNKREKVKTALVNPKYLKSINSLILHDATGAIEISREGDFWTIKDLLQNEKALSLPASGERVENLLNELIKVRNLYTISDKISRKSSLGLNNGTEFHIRYSYDEGSYRELIFGNQDFSLSSRYMMTGESTRVYEIDSSMDTYLTCSIQSWSEPYILSREASSSNDIQTVSVFITEDGKNESGKIEDIQKLTELRHGGLPSADEYQTIERENPLAELEIENGDKSRASLKIYLLPATEGTYLVKADYYKADAKRPFYSSYSKISSWTYNKIKEITL